MERVRDACADCGLGFSWGWLSPEGYDELLICADAGLCPHVSTSGLDLPMKLADFRAAGLPAFVRDCGPVLNEVFLEPRDGWRFRDEAGLAGLLLRLARDELQGFDPHHQPETWEQAWDRVLLPLVRP